MVLIAEYFLFFFIFQKKAYVNILLRIQTSKLFNSIIAEEKKEFWKSYA